MKMSQFTLGNALTSALVLSIIAAIPAPHAQAQTFGGFAPYVSFGVGVDPHSVAMGDLNGDGALDLAVANENSDTVSILLGKTDQFGKATGDFDPQVTFQVGTNPLSVAIGDLNGDGALDLAVANELTHNVSILLGDGAGGFAPQVTFPAGMRPYSVAMGDLNGDGALDLAVANTFSDNVSILLGNGDGTFDPQVTFTVGCGPEFVAMGDLNGDGALDLAVSNFGDLSNAPMPHCNGVAGNTVSILLGDGAGSFAPQQTFTVGTNPFSVAIGDLNSDGALDLAVGNYSSADVSILFGDGVGGFAPQVLFPVGMNPASVAMGDINGDNLLDLAVSNRASGNVSILLGDGMGGLTPQQSFNVGGGSRSLAMGDLNGDGELDIATAHFSMTSMMNPPDPDPGTVRILLHINCMGSPDINGDRSVNSADLAILLGQWGTAGSADLNCDGVVNAGDLATLLGNWG